MSADLYETWDAPGLADVAPPCFAEAACRRLLRRVRAFCVVLVALVVCLLITEQARAADFWALDCYYNTATGSTAQAAADACLPVWQSARGGQATLGPASVAADGKTATVLFIDHDGGSETRTEGCQGTCAAPSSTPAPASTDSSGVAFWVISSGAAICMALGFNGGRMR